MKQLGVLAGAAILLSLCGVGCASNANGGDNSEKLGQLALPLLANGPSGTQYRLRDAIFDITPNFWYYPTYDADSGAAATGGAATGPVSMVVSSEDNPNAASIQVDVEQGSYYIYLRSGWRMESVVNGVATPVAATLLNSQYQYVYVYPHSTSWASFQFGIGDRAIWLNGKLNIVMDVYENPNQYYGDADAGMATGGASFGGVGGSPVFGVGGASAVTGQASVGGAAH